jgi:Glycosyl hydrolase family 63 N-terminal domain
MFNYLGGNWGVRIKGRPKNKQSITTIFFYAGLSGIGDLHLDTPFNSQVIISFELLLI